MDAAQAELWKRLVEDQLATPDTWEVALSSGADKRQAWERLLGDKENCPEMCQEFVKTYRALLSELDPTKRTALTDRMVELVANSWIVVPILEGMGYYAINTKMVGQFDAIPGRHELGDVFERIPRPEEKPWKK